ncbi:MAG: ABC transporter permease [Caulobacteraceae bacterium]
MKNLNFSIVWICKKTVFFGILILLWELAFRIGVEELKIWEPYIFPSPFAVFLTIISLIRNRVLGIAIASSMRRIITGYALSLIIGSIIGIMMARFKYLDKNMNPLILGLQTLPSVCWLPFSILWFGLDESAVIFVIVVGSTFSIAIAIESGIKNINPIYLKAARNMGAKGVRIYTNVIIPSSIPSIISGMKQGWSFAWRALMAGEMLSAAKGLGQILLMGRDLADINQVVAVMLVIITLGLTVDKFVFGKIESNIRYRWGLIQ